MLLLKSPEGIHAQKFKRKELLKLELLCLQQSIDKGEDKYCFCSTFWFRYIKWVNVCNKYDYVKKINSFMSLTDL